MASTASASPGSKRGCMATAGRTSRSCSTCRARCRANGSSARAQGRDLDKFEREGDGFPERVRATYLARARAEPARFRIIDSTRPQEAVRAELARIVLAL